jgi:hypothetical protein
VDIPQVAFSVFVALLKRPKKLEQWFTETKKQRGIETKSATPETLFLGVTP